MKSLFESLPAGVKYSDPHDQLRYEESQRFPDWKKAAFDADMRHDANADWKEPLTEEERLAEEKELAEENARLRAESMEDDAIEYEFRANAEIVGDFFSRRKREDD